ncbi:MAG: hypothetical protein HY537_00600 [Deltaproteobacteria bacterium]|nr:hypothetical protein [Deltaproteobacteria bacterium]
MRASNVVGHCQSNPPGYDVWNAKLMNGRPRYWHPKEEISSWTDEERERVLEALGELPAVLKDEGIDGIFRLKNALIPDNPASNSFSSVVLYDVAFSKQFNLTQVLGHELTHRLRKSLSDAEFASFQKAAKWKVDPKTGLLRSHRPENQFLRRNGMLSPEEDFCDDVSMYFLQPNKLKQIAPKVFDWIDNHVKLWRVK